jgi:pimeloyl-[acyl-carrier protein] methyl ester esterase
MAETLFLHGWGLHGGIWSGVLADLPGLAPDLSGYGVEPTVSPYSAEGLADELTKTLVTKILAGTLSSPVNLVGWSMGGMVALALAARYPDKVARLVLVGTSPAFVNRPGWTLGLEPEVLDGFATDLNQDYRATLLRFLALQARGGDAARAVVAHLREQVFARGEPSASVLASGLELLRGVDLRKAAEAVSSPTLVIHGAHDKLCPVAAGQWLAGRIPQARLAVHDGASHAPFISHPAWFAEKLTDFLHG